MHIQSQSVELLQKYIQIQYFHHLIIHEYPYQQTSLHHHIKKLALLHHSYFFRKCSILYQVPIYCLWIIHIFVFP